MAFHGLIGLLVFVAIGRVEQKEPLGSEVLLIVVIVDFGLQKMLKLCQFLLLKVVVLNLPIEQNTGTIAFIESNFFFILYDKCACTVGEKSVSSFVQTQTLIVRLHPNNIIHQQAGQEQTLNQSPLLISAHIIYFPFQQIIPMNYRLNYSICPLHEEPLNYICLHSNCEQHRVICAICREERHTQSHHALPLKLYLSRKLQRLKCLTESEVRTIEDSLEEQKRKNTKAFDDLGIQILEKLTQSKEQFEKFYDLQLISLRECMNLINQEEIDVQKLELIESAARAANNYEQYLQATSEKLRSVSDEFLVQMETLHPHQLLIDKYWVGHSEIDVNRSLLTSNNNDYKIAYLSKPISKNCKTNFKVLKNTNNWVAVGVCHSEIVQERNFGFRYHTIGHGVYALSSNGGIWSHFRPDSNNKLGGICFSENETVTVGYDLNCRCVCFKGENGDQISLEVDPGEKGTLHFCVLFYFQGDEIEIIHDLS